MVEGPMHFQNRAFYALVLAIFFFVGSHPSYAETPTRPPARTPDDLPLIAVDTVSEISRSNVIKLANGVSYSLDEIRIPFAYESAVTELLKGALLNKKVGVYSDKPQDSPNALDRLGFPLAHILQEDGTWVQATLVSKGLAWVSGSADSQALLSSLYRAENTAQEEKAGLWADPKYSIKTSATIADTLNSFQVYEGRISGYGIGKSNLPIFYLDKKEGDNLAPFALQLGTPKIKEFRDPGRTLSRLKGKTLRVRGWVEKQNRIPTIIVTHAEQVQVLDAPAALTEN